MAGRSMRADVLGELHSLTQFGVVGNLTDAQLLDRFLAGGGEVAELAFQALVIRHGRMVLGVCGNILRDPDDAQDAFQATFLVLASRARSVRRQNSLGSWLLAVARRVAMRSRADAARRRVHERRAAETKADHAPSPPESWPEVHEEIDRLPERYREPVVLCYLEGLTTEAAALRLGCPKGTVLSRLSRARERLQRKLTRRGFLPTGVLPAARSPEATQVAVPPALLSATVRASLIFSEQPSIAASLSSTTAVSLAKGVIYAMMITKTKILAGTVLACVLTLGALHTFARQAGGPAGPGKTAAPQPRADKLKEALLLRSQAAQRAFEMTAKDLSSGRLTDIEVLYRWSHRWMDADIAASNTKQDVIAAAEAHLKRMTDLEKAAPELKKVVDVFPASAEAAATYYRLDAEDSLAEARR